MAENGLPEVPVNVRRNVRAVLLSKAGGVLVSDFIKDYKGLLKESLFIKDLGFENMSDFFKALPDVARLEYDEKCMAHRLYGVGDPNTYMSLSAKNAQKAKDGDRGRGSNRGRGRGDKTGDDSEDQYSKLIPNAKGMYSLCFPRRNIEETEEDIREKFSVVGDPDDVNIIEKFVFVRFRSKELAIKALETFKSISIRLADEKGSRRPADRSPQRQDRSNKDHTQSDSIMESRRDKKRDGGGGGGGGGGGRGVRGDRVEVYIGNLSQDATQEDVEDLVSEFSPLAVRLTRSSDNSRKAFAFIDFGQPYRDKAEMLIEKLDQTQHKGRKLLARYAHNNAKPQERKDSGSGKASGSTASENKPYSKSIWSKSSENTNNNTVVSLDDDDSWDNDVGVEKTSPNNASDFNIGVKSEPPKTGGSIWSTARTSNTEGGASPLKSPILEQAYSQPSAGTQQLIFSPQSPVQTDQVQARFSQIPEKSTQNQPVFSQTFTRSPVKSDQDLLVESMTSFLRSPVKPEQDLGTSEVTYTRSPVKTENGMQITIQQSPVGQHKRNLASDFAQLGLKDGANAKYLPTGNESQNGDMTRAETLVVEDNDEMPMLEPSVVETMPPLSPIASPNSSKIFVANFPYGERDHELYGLFCNYGVRHIDVGNRTYTMKSTRAVITLQSPEMAHLAINDLNQISYKGRRLLVTAAKENLVRSPGEEYRHMQGGASNTGFSSPSQRFHQTARSPVVTSPASRSPAVISPASSSSSLVENKVAFKSWYALLQTFKIVMMKLGGRVRDIVYKPQERLTVFVTSVFDEKNFWGQVIEDNSTLETLENVMQALQLDETKIGPTKGLGRCTAKFDNEWYRAWIIAEKGYSVDVFYVDYGNIATVPKNSTSLTCPDLWEHKPALRPFRLTEGSAIDLKPLETQVVTLQVVKSGVDETGYLMEVIVTK